jgi:hypothetical protein
MFMNGFASTGGPLGWLPLILTVVLLGIPALVGLASRRSAGRRGPGLGLRKTD